MLVKIQKDNKILRVEEDVVSSFIGRGFKVCYKNEPIVKESNEPIIVVDSKELDTETPKKKPGRKSKKSV